MLSKRILLDFRLHKRLSKGVFILFDHFSLLPVSFDLDFFHFFYRRFIFAWDFLDLFHHVFFHSLIFSFGLFEFVHLTFSQILYFTLLSFEFLLFFTLSLMILNNDKKNLVMIISEYQLVSDGNKGGVKLLLIFFITGLFYFVQCK